ncbi:MAG: hypothetical protein WC869_12320 [Phycisphaerae bacterium]
MLEAFANLKVLLTYRRDGSDRKAAGTLKSVGDNYVILESEANNFAVPFDQIQRMQVMDLGVRVHVMADSNAVPARATLGMAYLRKGIVWIPEYSLKVLDEDSAELTLRGTLVNDAEDLVHCDVNFVVGVPHFSHTDYLAPVAAGQMIRAIGTAVAPSQVQTQLMNRAALLSSNQNLSPQTDDSRVPGIQTGESLEKVLGNLPQMEGPAATDYTVYAKKDLTIRRGERAIVTLFRHQIKYSHIYRWTLPDALEHMLVLRNDTDTAWTTGPALALSGDRAMSEDLLRYTPKGGAGELPVTAAINVAREQKETEADRKLKAHQPKPDFYLDLVKLDGRLMLKNFEKRPITVIITLPVSGKPLEASDGGEITVDTQKLRLEDRAGSIQWKTTIESGQSKTLTYSYERYVPSH